MGLLATNWPTSKWEEGDSEGEGEGEGEERTHSVTRETYSVWHGVSLLHERGVPELDNS